MLAPLTISASLYKAHAPSLTEAYVELDLSGLGADYQPASLHATIPAHRAGEIGQLLCGLASRASATQKEEIHQHLAVMTVDHEVSGDDDDAARAKGIAQLVMMFAIYLSLHLRGGERSPSGKPTVTGLASMASIAPSPSA